MSCKGNEIILECINKFNPLLRKYALLLGYEDAYSDLRLELIIVIKKISTKHIKSNINPSILKYIKNQFTTNT